MTHKSRPHTKVNRLYSRTLTLIAKEVEAISKLSQYGDKLSASTARDLINYTKLLKELKEAADKMKAEQIDQEKAASKAVSTEELEKALAGAVGAQAGLGVKP